MANEIELKIGLGDDPMAVERILGALPPEVRSHRQVNWYFDGPADDLRASGWSLRIRRQDEVVILTIKGGAVAVGDFTRRGEWEQRLGRQDWDRLRAEPRGVAALFRAAVDELAIPMDAGLKHVAVEPLGETRTHRRVHPLPGGDLYVEVDSTEYPDGSVVHEVEVEIPTDEAHTDATGQLRQVFEDAGVAWAPSQLSKQARFRRVLAALKDADDNVGLE